MPPRKRAADAHHEAIPQRRSSRQAAAAATKNETLPPVKRQKTTAKLRAGPVASSINVPSARPSKAVQTAGTSSPTKTLESVDVDAIPDMNPEAPRHDGEWYWLMKAEPETRLENGVDVKFSIDDLKAKTKPEGWDARNHMRNMNVGDKAFFYHSNCKDPGIVGIMEIVKEFSQDASAREPGTPYYDPKSTKENPRWSLVHVEFRKKFAVPITLKELRELGTPGGPLENMQMLKQSRLSVSRVSDQEWRALCQIADEKANEAGLEHERAKGS
ncbi:hypothetical protein E4U42_006257 [Claviceps africana]|uniref:Thymocyte nuclear protein 1 n=1 Tax=Claviceps africana TaxID=83212 RepID=A0A8K0NJF7_9HYPO|nr:hypothetical protein E4U42_006257 [Claviceps africana]